VIRIDEFDLFGYQHLSARYVFGPGLNVVTGPNESGKSTLHEALTVGLFGFGCEDRRRSGGRSAKGLRRPWSGPPFGGVLTVVDRAGRRLRVRWDFETDLVDVTDATTGGVVLREQPPQRTDYTVGLELLGISREDHRQLSCLFQVSLEPVRPSETLRQSLQRAVETTAATEGGVEAADQRLRALLSDLGVHAGHYGSIPTGRLARAQAEVRDLKSRIEHAAQDRRGLEELATEGLELETQLAQVDERIVAHQQAALRATADRLAADHRRGRRLARAAPPAEAEAHAELPTDLDGRVGAARDRLADVQRRVAETRDAEVSSAGELAEARDSARHAESVRSALAAYADVDTSAEEAVRTELGRLRWAAPAVTPPAAPPPRDPVLQRFRAQRPRAEAHAAQRAVRPGPLLALAVTLAAAGIGAGLAVHPAALVLALVGVIVAVAALRRPDAPTLLTFEGRPVAELARAADAEERAWLAYEAAAREHERVGTESAGIRDAALAALRRLLAAGDEPAPALRSRAEDYLRECAKHREHADADRLAERMAARAHAAAEPGEAVRTAEQELREAERELWRLLRRAGIDEDDLALALEAFEVRVAADATRREEAERHADAAGRLEQLLDGRSLDDLAAAAERAAAALETHIATHGTRTGGTPDRPAAERDAKARDQLIEDLAGLRARIDERETTLDDPADLELQLGEASARRSRMLLERDAARIAREELAEAARTAHRKVAPHLNAALAHVLPHITRGRYREAMVGDDLSIRVVVPGTGNVVEVERLSRGTRDQIALIERLELARLLDPMGGGTPLLLDDCFSHTDEHRLPLAIELLAHVAERRQVFVFTDARDVVTAVRSVDEAAVVVELPDPVAKPALETA
jgi:hypothetical protein